MGFVFLQVLHCTSTATYHIFYVIIEFKTFCKVTNSKIVFNFSYKEDKVLILVTNNFNIADNCCFLYRAIFITKISRTKPVAQTEVSSSDHVQLLKEKFPLVITLSKKISLVRWAGKCILKRSEAHSDRVSHCG